MWKDLYTNLVSRVRTKKLRRDLGKMVKIFNSTCEDPSKVLLNKSSKGEKLIRLLEEGLLKYGCRSLTTNGTYSADLAATVSAFNRHFCPEIFIKEKKKVI